MTSRYVAIPIMLVLAVLQTAVWPRFPILGLIPQLPLLLVLSWGLQRGMIEGVIWAFIAGLVVDLFTVGPVGLTALGYMTAVLLSVWFAQLLPESRLFMPALVGGIGTLLYLAVYLPGLRLVGFPISLPQATALLPLALLHVGLILPVYWLMLIIDRTINPPRVQL